MFRSLVIAVVVLWAGCAGRPKTEGARTEGREAPPARQMTDDERQLSEHFLPGCAQHGTSTAEEIVFYCPEQAVFFAVRDLDGEGSPDAIFNAWLEELRARTGAEVEVIERAEAKQFGPQTVALFLKLRTPDMPPEGFVEAVVARTNFNGTWKRVWCSASGAEPAGLARCQNDLLSVAVISAP